MVVECSNTHLLICYLSVIFCLPRALDLVECALEIYSCHVVPLMEMTGHVACAQICKTRQF